jgi:hypothetical protein
VHRHDAICISGVGDIQCCDAALLHGCYLDRGIDEMRRDTAALSSPAALFGRRG